MRIQIKLIFLVTIFINFSCGDDFGRFDNCERINGSGTVTTRTLELSADISEIELNIPAEFVISSGTSQEIIIEGHPNVLDLIESDSRVNGNKWTILNESFCINSDETKIHARLTSLSSFEVNGVADVKSDGILDNIAESLDLEVNGAGKLELDFTENNTINIDLNGAGEIILSGQTENATIDVSGASEIKLHEMRSTNCEIDINGASEVEVNVITDLDVNINGVGKVCYLGTPTITSDIDGAGEIVDCN